MITDLHNLTDKEINLSIDYLECIFSHLPFYMHLTNVFVLPEIIKSTMARQAVKIEQMEKGNLNKTLYQKCV